MFDIKDNKTFMDSVHGYINIPKCFVEHLIDTEYFQRLRNIDQTSIRVLYPDAKHDRFGHSLGVFHLGSKAVNSLLENFSKDKYWNIFSDHNNIIFWAKNKILFLIACILHDIGHAPFSHSLELEVVLNSGGKATFSGELAKLINKGENNTGDDEIMGAQITAAPHEQVGARLVIERFKEPIKNIFKDLKKISYPNMADNSILYAEYYQYNPIIDIDEKTLDADICFIARMIIGLKYKDYSPENQIKNCFIELLNGNNFDVDKLDYIIRDTKMSGISNIAIDVERLLNSLSIVTKTVYKNKKFNKTNELSNVTIHSFKNSEKNEKVNIKGNFKGILKVRQGVTVEIAKGSTFISLSGTESAARINYISQAASFDKNTQLYQNGEPIIAGDNEIKDLTGVPNHKIFECDIRNATVLSENGFNFKVSEHDTVELNVNGYCNITITGEFDSKGAISFFENLEITGTINEIVILGNLIKKDVPTKNSYNAFSVGFKKQAINIIANVLEARNYLYLWCYAHHKVIYYANFLIPVLTHELFKLEQTNFLTRTINYNNITYIDDSYIWSAIRYFNDNMQETKLKELCKEILCRKYKRSLYKSLAEYDLLFEEFSDEQKLDIMNFFSKNSGSEMNVLNDVRENTAGFVNERWLELLKKEHKEIKNIFNVVFVCSGYKQKGKDAHNTFIFINNEVVPVEKLSLLHDQTAISQRSTSHYFYLYYDTTTEDVDLLKEEANNFKIAIKKFFKDNIKSLENILK